MKKIFTFILLFYILSIHFVYAQSSGINTTFMILSINSGANTYYDMQASTGNPDLQGTNLGSYDYGAGNTLVIKGAESNVYKCGSCDITGTSLEYRVWLTSGGASGSFIPVALGFSSGFGNGCGGQDQKWDKTDGTVNIAARPNGNYTLEVRVKAQQASCGTTVHLADNSGANYQATYTVSNSVLSVSLSELFATYLEKSIKFSWQTASETNNTQFNIQRSPNNQTWQTIGSVKATNNPNGAKYNFTDEAPLSTINYYRLQMVDNDGKTTYSKVVAVSTDGGKKSLAVYPNPVKSELNLLTDGNTEGVSIFDMTGRAVRQYNDNRTKVNVADLPNGVYFVRLIDKNGLASEPVRFLKQ